MKLNGIHHITAITGDALANVDFHTRVLGLRLIAKTVNQDDPGAYHLFYGDEHGSPGNDLTFFEYPGAISGRAGAGMVHRVVWRITSPDAFDFWADRVAGEGLPVTREDDGLIFASPEGLEHELVLDSSGDPPLRARHPEIPEELALAGFAGVRMYSLRPDASVQVLEGVLEATPQPDDVWQLRGDRRGGTVQLDALPADRGIPGAGTVHHVAFYAPAAEHPQWPEVLRGAGLQPTPVIDRHYFHSIYFREPGGVLYELADDGPGFTVDQSLDQLGVKVILPPWLESRRQQIESHLTPIPDPRADWVTTS